MTVAIPPSEGQLTDEPQVSVGHDDHAEHDHAVAGAVSREEIDASCRPVVSLWIASSVFWLMAATIFGLLASFKMHTPDWPAGLADIAQLTFGRVRPAHLNIVAYGWTAMIALGASLWLMARLCRVKLAFAPALFVVGIYWNILVVYGVVAILIGKSTSVEWLEFPPYIALGFAPAYLVIAASIIKMQLTHKASHLYVTQWYIFAATIWFPILYVVVNLIIFTELGTGVIQEMVHWWFGHNFLGLFLTPIGVGTAYYLIPKVIGRPIHSYYLSVLGFWTLALFYNWAGTHHLIGGPVPSWIVTAGIVGSMMMFIPVISVAINHHTTMLGHFHKLWLSPVLRFTVAGAMTYTLVSVQGSLMSLRDMNLYTHFTHYTVGHAHWGVYGFFSMIMFGAIYYIMPRLLKREWASPFLISVHFWTCLIGVNIYFLALTWGGWYQGKMLSEPTTFSDTLKFLEIVDYTVIYLWLRSLGGTLMLIGHIVFAILLVGIFIGVGAERKGPALFYDPILRKAKKGDH